jgi:hypothetical protein
MLPMPYPVNQLPTPPRYHRKADVISRCYHVAPWLTKRSA